MSQLGNEVATYDYIDKFGHLIFQAVRYEPKGFRQRRPDGNGGYIWDLNGTRRVPYRLPELRRGIEEQRTIVVAEGEKDVETLVAAGFCATTNAGGCNWTWTIDFVERFSGAKRIVVITDCDEGDPAKGTRKGRGIARHRAALLLTVCEDVRVVDLYPQRHDGYYVTDWLADGHTAEELERSSRLRRGFSALAFTQLDGKIHYDFFHGGKSI